MGNIIELQWKMFHVQCKVIPFRYLDIPEGSDVTGILSDEELNSMRKEKIQYYGDALNELNIENGKLRRRINELEYELAKIKKENADKSWSETH